ncbi:hypothetical protein GF406_15585 [candidate division KSB1 bacterium]|nr:hypothetical protein [candidate division KSB1 bacterium]
MYKSIIYSTLLFTLLLFASSFATTLVEVKGDVRVRQGLDESWQNAAAGMELQDIDTILCLEGRAVLQLDDGQRFTLGSQSILDIGDLKTVTRQQLFLYLMSLKIEQLPDRPQGTPVRLGKVSIVHGTKPTSESADDSFDDRIEQELNGAKALYANELYANAIIKWHKIRKRYPQQGSCGEIDSRIALSFEQLKETGRAIDAWQRVQEQTAECETPQAQQLARTAEQHLHDLMP